MRVRTFSGEFEVQNRDELPVAVRIVNSIIGKLTCAPEGHKDVRPQDLPDDVQINWPRVVNRLKVLASVDPVAFPTSRAGCFEIFEEREHFWVRVEFPPGMSPESVRLVWRPAPAAA